MTFSTTLILSVQHVSNPLFFLTLSLEDTVKLFSEMSLQMCVCVHVPAWVCVDSWVGMSTCMCGYVLVHSPSIVFILCGSSHNEAFVVFFAHLCSYCGYWSNRASPSVTVLLQLLIFSLFSSSYFACSVLHLSSFVVSISICVLVRSSNILCYLLTVWGWN